VYEPPEHIPAMPYNARADAYPWLPTAKATAASAAKAEETR
jgi:hypothetical protein